MSTTNQLPDPIPGIRNPFYYSSFFNIEGYYKVPYEGLNKAIIDQLIIKGLSPYLQSENCKEYALISHNYQHYTGQQNSLTGITNEIEFNILSYATTNKKRVPNLSFKDVLLGNDTTKLIGNCRMLVTCDNEFAVDAGIKLYGEPKVVASFAGTNIPSLNSTDNESYSWMVKCDDIEGLKIETGTINYSSYQANLANENFVIANISPVTQFGVRDKKLIGCNLSIFPTSKLYFTPNNQKLEFGTSFNSKKTNELEATINSDLANVERAVLVALLFNHSESFAIRTCESQPVAIQNGPYYI